jgi:hypothetical protein
MVPDSALQPENPYQSPQTASVVSLSSSALPTQVDWKSILKRWELLRLPYNAIVGLAGVFSLAMFPQAILPRVGGGIIAYGILANVMYLLGPVTELYLNWFLDAWEGRFVPRPVARFVRSRFLTALLFGGGSLFSVGLTLAVGLGGAFAAAMPNGS